MNYECDICGYLDAIEVPNCRHYTGGQPIHICSNCGFVYVKKRRSSDEIARSWSDEVFSNKFNKDTYTARVPAVKARQTYVADFIDTELGLNNKEVCDIGAGEGQFLEIIQNDYQAKVYGVEPSEKNSLLLKKNNFKHFIGTAENFRNNEMFKTKIGTFDIVTMMWTLCNSFSCKEMMNVAFDLLKPGGHLCIAEGSRIMVPFKKPLHYYFSKMKADLHPYHFSMNSLKNLFQISGYEVTNVNRYIDSDVLCMIGKKMSKNNDISKSNIQKDKPNEVADFFNRWHKETKAYYLNS